ncbi:MAG TPA: phosphonate ABC transporter ATP-binding protein [Candidatus Kapabacteria bacterium]|nr:phosphonate ABC transporter ATP-binding protein [Candidatus Kapabacteria bacterium]
MLLRPFAPLLLGLAVLLGACGDGSDVSSPKRRIVIGLNPSEKSENVQRNARVLAKLIEDRVGMPVEMFVAQDYTGLVLALRSRNIDFAFFAPLSYVFAEREADARVLLKAERKGRPYYYGAIIVNADSAYRTLDDLKGRTIAWVDPTSASGYLFPKAALIEAGIDPEKHFSQQTFAGGHDAVILSVINGTIAAGATYSNDTLGASGSWTQLGDGAFRGRVRPIHFSRPIPGDNLATTQSMIDEHGDIVEKVRTAVMGLTSDSAGRALMQSMYHVDAMIPATSEDYQPVRDAAEALDLDITGTPNPDLRRNDTISTLLFAIATALFLGGLVWQTLAERRRRTRASRIATAAASAADTDRQFSMRDLGVIFTDRDGQTFTALKSVSVDIDRGEFIAVIGLSGAGKSTFLRCLNRMNEPTSGTVLFEGRDVTHVTGRALTELRRQIGFIFQQFNLVRSLPVLQNVLSGRLAYAPGLRSFFGSFAQKDVDLARHYLSEVGLVEKIHNRADALSGGQQQRVAIARALVQQPKVILADEPMASLDPKLSEVILQLLRKFNRDEGITVIVNLHVLELARRYADRIIAFRAGEIHFDGPPDALTPEIVEEVYRTSREQMEKL